MNAEEALRLIPDFAPNRAKLAQLLVVVEDARDEIERDATLAGWHNRFRELAALILLSETANKGTPEFRKARTALTRAVDAARIFARKHGLTPNTRRAVREGARCVLETLR